jgi:hypothetical protein
MVAIALLTALVAACGDGDESTPTASATPTASPTASPSPTPTPVSSLRDVDFTAPAIVGALIARAGGGEIDPTRVRFAQLIDGGPEEAVVIVDSGGTAGEIGAGVFRLVEGQPGLVQFFSYNGRLDLNRELIVTRAGVYEAGDADCCPSKLHEVTYQWNGTEFAVTTDQVVPNPSR